MTQMSVRNRRRRRGQTERIMILASGPATSGGASGDNETSASPMRPNAWSEDVFPACGVADKYKYNKKRIDK